MKITLVLLASLLVGSVGASAQTHSAANSPAPAQSRLGMNLAGPADWNTELAFVDAFHMARS